MDDAIDPESEKVSEKGEPSHECVFTWTIENATKYPRRFCSYGFAVEALCKSRFKIVTKYHEKYPNAKNINVGLQRIDEHEIPIEVELEIALLSINGEVYCSTEQSYISLPNRSPQYCFSETFVASPEHLKLQTSFSSDDHENLHLKTKGLIGSIGTDHRVFLLPSNILVIKGVVKTSLCCEVSFTQQTHTNRLLDHFRKAYQTGLLTDVRLKLGSEFIGVHRFVLCARSPVFRKMFEHDTLEQRTSEIVIDDMERSALDALLIYLYTGVVKQEPWEDLAKLYIAADRYEVMSLHEACSSVLSTLVEERSVCKILELADLYEDEKLRMDAISFVTFNFSKVKVQQEWKDIVCQNPQLASDVLLAVSSRLK